MATAFDWASLLGSKPLLKTGGNITASSLGERSVVGFYFSAHWCPPCRGFTPDLAEAYKGMPEGSNCEIIFVSGDRDEEAFKEYHGEMPFAALDFNEKATNRALNKKFGCEGIPYLVLCDGKTGEVITTEGRRVVSTHGPKFALQAPKLAEAKETAKQKVKDLSILGAVTDVAGQALSLDAAEVVVVACGAPGNRGWAQFVKPKLLEAYAALKAEGKKFEVVYCSEDASESNDGPWGFIPSGTNQSLFEALNATGAPNLLVLSKGESGEFEVLVTDASRPVYENGADAYPWTAEGIAAGEVRKAEKMKQMLKQMEDLQLLKDNDDVVGKGGAKVSLADIQEGADVIGLYFSAHWCPPCRGFTPRLAAMYEECKAAGKRFEVIFVSSDRDQGSFDEYFSEMPWKALSYSKRDLKGKLSDMYGVEGIPSLVLLSSNGTEITRNGREIVGIGADFFPWGPEQMAAGKKAQAEKEAAAARAALQTEEEAVEEAKSAGQVPFRRVVGEPGNSTINRTGDSQYEVEFKSFDTFASEGFGASGKWYYEIECLSVGQGIAQAGFADESFKGSMRGEGVGDDNHSWGFDGNRVCKWGNAGNAQYGKKWSDGDVLGCAVDLDKKTVEFFLNGESMGVAFEGIDVTGKIRAAVTAQGRDYKLRINLGNNIKHSAPEGFSYGKSS